MFGGESAAGGGVAAREDLGGLWEREKELILRLLLGTLITERSEFIDSSAAVLTHAGLVAGLVSGEGRLSCKSEVNSSFGVFFRCSLLRTKDLTRRPNPRSSIDIWVSGSVAALASEGAEVGRPFGLAICCGGLVGMRFVAAFGEV